MSFRRLIHEVHRRSLWQVLGIYVAVSWLVLQVVDVIGSSFGLPEWVAPAALILLLLGLPVVLATAFVQEGIAPRAPAPPAESPPAPAEGEAGPAVPAPASAGAPRRFLTWRRALLGGVGAFALLGIVTAAYLFMRSAGIGPAGTLVAKGVLDEQERLVLADFASATDTVLATTVTETVRRALAESSTLRFVERDQLAETLRRMGRDPKTSAIDAGTAREIAIREGLKGFVGGVVDRVGTGYVLSADLVLAESGETALSHQETARDDADLIDAIDRLSRRFRERAGESLREVNASPPLAAVTTSSLAALQRYVQGAIAYNRRGDAEAGISLYREAVGIDTTFAMAYRALAVVYANEGRGRSLVLDAMDHAMRHEDRLTSLERAMLDAFYQQTVTFDRDATVTAYRRILELDPEPSLAVLNNLGVAYEGLRRYEDAEETFARGVATGRAAWQTHHGLVRVAYALGRRDEARTALERARVAVPDSARWDVTAFALDISDGAYEGADSAVARYEARYRRDPDTPLRTTLWRAQLALVRGELAEAEDQMRRRMDLLADRGIRVPYLGQALGLAWSRLEAGDPAGAHAVMDDALARQPLDSIRPLDRPYFGLAIMYAEAGDAPRARRFLQEWESEVDPEVDDPLGVGAGGAMAFIALSEGRPEEAVDRFREVDETIGGCPICRLPEMGRAYDEAGIPDSVIAVYERFLNTPWWNRLPEERARGPILERLGQLYDERGDLEDAAKYYAMFIELWAEADGVLQPRVQAARGRLQQIVEERG